MEDNKVPYIVYESESAKHERTVIRLLKVIVVLICALLVSNMAWLYVFNQYDITSETVTIEGADEANANYMGAQASGVINNERKDTD